MAETVHNERLIIRALRPVYTGLTPVAEALMRFACGALLALHGSGKIVAPFGAVEMVEQIGFAPGWFWSPLLAVCEFGSGILLAVGFLTRPAAAIATVILAVTIYFHWIVLGQGLEGAEKSVLWTTITLFFVFRGANALSVDRALGRAF